MNIIQRLSLVAIALLINVGASAQQGFGTNSPAPSAVVDMAASNKGVLFPRVSLTGISDTTTIPNAANSLIVFNNVNAGTAPNNVTIGIYYWDSIAAKWIRLLAQGQTGVVENIRTTTNPVETILPDDYTVVFNLTQTGTLALPDPATSKGRILVIVNYSSPPSTSTITFNYQITRDHVTTPKDNSQSGTHNVISGTTVYIGPMVSLAGKITIQSNGIVWLIIS